MLERSLSKRFARPLVSQRSRPLHLLRPEVAIALARLVTDQATASRVIVEGIVDARAGDVAASQTSSGVLP